MRLTIVRIENGKRRVLWPEFLLFVIASYAAFIGSAEIFWKLFSGGFSSLIGLLALFVATLYVVRVTAEEFALPVHIHETWLNHDGE
jgi:hypothetical protein